MCACAQVRVHSCPFRFVERKAPLPATTLLHHPFHASSEGNFKLEYLESHYGITENTLESMYKYAKFQFECGNYSGAAEVHSPPRA